MGQSGGQLVRFVKFMWVFFFCGKIRLRSIAKKKKKIFFYMKTRKVFHTQFTTSPPRRFHLYARVPKTQLALEIWYLKKSFYQQTRGHLATVNMSSFLLRPTVRFSIESHSLFWLFRLGFSDIWRSCVGCHLARCFVLDEKTAKHAIHSRYEHENEKL